MRFAADSGRCASNHRLGLWALLLLVPGTIPSVVGAQSAEETAVFESFFPDDPAAGERCSQWLADPDSGTYSDEQVLEMIRRGLRSAGDYTSQAIQQVSTRFIWNKEPSPLKDKALELMYHASFSPSGLTRYYAVYYGLSVAQPKSETILNRLAALAMRNENATRIIWGIQHSKQEQQFVAALEPYVSIDNPGIRERARSLIEKVGQASEYIAVVKSPAGDTKGITRDPNDYEGTFKDLYETLGARYPCFELKGINWKAVGAEFIPRSKVVRSREQFGLLCMELVARLEDSHAHLLPGSAQVPEPPLPRLDCGFFCLADAQGRPAVYHVDPDGPADKAGIEVGMVVRTINDDKAINAIDRMMNLAARYIGYSSRRQLRYDAYRAFNRQMEAGEIVRLETEAPDGHRHRFAVRATLNGRYIPRLPVPKEGIPDSASVSWKMLEGGTGYLYVRRIGRNLTDKLDRAIADLQEARGLILDVRGNSGGGFDGRKAFVNFYTDDDTTEPNRPRYKGPIAVLIDSKCVSAGEGWTSWFVATDRARLFGQTTAGASARKIEYPLTNGLYKVRLPVKPYRGFLRRVIERRGLEPDVPVRQTAADLAIGRDTVLETAREYLLGLSEDPNSTPEADRH